MRLACSDLTVTNQSAGHWLPLERKTELTEDILSGLKPSNSRSPHTSFEHEDQQCLHPKRHLPPIRPAFASWKVYHVGIRVPDFDEAIAWYTTKLDFRLVKSAVIGNLTFGFVSPATDDSFSVEIWPDQVRPTVRPMRISVTATHYRDGTISACMSTTLTLRLRNSSAATSRSLASRTMCPCLACASLSSAILGATYWK
jgi:hypothetical protein